MTPTLGFPVTWGTIMVDYVYNGSTTLDLEKYLQTEPNPRSKELASQPKITMMRTGFLSMFSFTVLDTNFGIEKSIAIRSGFKPTSFSNRKSRYLPLGQHCLEI